LIRGGTHVVVEVDVHDVTVEGPGAVLEGAGLGVVGVLAEGVMAVGAEVTRRDPEDLPC